MSKLKKLEIIGIFAIFGLSIILHFLYPWTGLDFVKPFSAINESVFEHLKMIYFAGLFYAIFEFFIGPRDNKNFIFAKAIALLFIPIFVAAIFYTYTSAVGHNILWVDILTTFLTVFFSQKISYRLMSSDKDFSKYTTLGGGILIIMTFMFMIFTFVHPDLCIFKVPENLGELPVKG